MKHRLRIWAAALVLSAVTVPCGAAEPAGLSVSVPGGVLRATLPNGLRVVVIPDRLAPVVTTEMNYLAGSNDAPEGFPGTAHALEHMMFRGSEGLDRDQLAEIGALLGGVYNADTTETVTQYTYTVPADDLSVALRIEALRMHGLTLSQADWEQERGAIDQEVSRDLSSPVYNYLTQAQAILFHGTPYQHDALGTRPSFEKTDAALIRRFYETWYAPNNAILVIAGDVQPDDALARAKAAFGDVPSRPVPAHAAFAVQPVKPETLTLDTNFPVGLVTIAYRMPGLKYDDFAAADILSDVLASERGALVRPGAGRQGADGAIQLPGEARCRLRHGVRGLPVGRGSRPRAGRCPPDHRRGRAERRPAGTGRRGEAAGTGATRLRRQQHPGAWPEAGPGRWPSRTRSRPRIWRAPMTPSRWRMSTGWPASCWTRITP